MWSFQLWWMPSGWVCRQNLNIKHSKQKVGLVGGTGLYPSSSRGHGRRVESVTTPWIKEWLQACLDYLLRSCPWFKSKKVGDICLPCMKPSFQAPLVKNLINNKIECAIHAAVAVVARLPPEPLPLCWQYSMRPLAKSLGLAVCEYQPQEPNSSISTFFSFLLPCLVKTCLCMIELHQKRQYGKVWHLRVLKHVQKKKKSLYRIKDDFLLMVWIIKDVGISATECELVMHHWAG